MNGFQTNPKPKSVALAQSALWLWTAWTCAFGFIQTRAQIPEIEQALDAADIRSFINISPDVMLKAAAAGYGALALISALVIVKIGSGKGWARSGLLWGVIFQIFFMAFPPYDRHDLVAAIPDLGLQFFALYLLYTKPGSGWFRRTAPAQGERY